MQLIENKENLILLIEDNGIGLTMHLRDFAMDADDAAAASTATAAGTDDAHAVPPRALKDGLVIARRDLAIDVREVQAVADRAHVRPTPKGQRSVGRGGRNCIWPWTGSRRSATRSPRACWSTPSPPGGR